MHQVSKTVWIEESLRRQRAPRVRRPEKRSAPTPPYAALSMQLPRGGSEDQPDQDNRPNLFLRAIIQRKVEGGL